MLDQHNFKPSSKLCSYWSSLPQGSSFIGKTKVPALFSEHKSFSIEYILFISLILFEAFIIYFLAHQGIPYIVMAILAAVEILIAILPLFWQGKQKLNKAFVDTQIFVYATLYKWSNPSDTEMNKNLGKSVKQWQTARTVITLMEIVFGLVIVGFGFWKFWTYFNIYGNTLFQALAGRLILISILLGIIVHLFVTKTVFLHMLMKNRLSKELAQKTAGNANYIDTDNGYTMVDIPVSIFATTPKFERYSVDNVTNPQMCRAQLLKKIDVNTYSNDANDLKKVEASNGAASQVFSNDTGFDTGATFLYTKLLRDTDIQSIITAQKAAHSFEQEIIAAIAKKEQLLKVM